MSLPVPVNIALNFSTGILTHNVLAPPAIPAPVPMLSMEMIATQMWTYGYVMNQNKLTSTVLHKYMPIVQSGHDCGMMIPDITPPVPSNTYYAIMWPFSSRKITFAASTVKMDKQPTGCAVFPIIPMMTCGDPISAPAASVSPIQLLNNVRVGMTRGDRLMGLANIAISVVIDFVIEYGFAKKGKKYVSKKGTKWTKEGFSEFMGGLPKLVGGRTVKEASEMASEQVAKEIRENAFMWAAKETLGKAGFSRPDFTKKMLNSLCQGGLSLFTDNPTLKLGVGAPTGNVEVSWSEEKGYVTQASSFGVQRDSTGQEQRWGEDLP